MHNIVVRPFSTILI